MICLAEVAAPDAGDFMKFLGCVLFVMVIVEKYLLIQGRNKTQKREVSFSEEFASKQEVARVDKDVRELGSRVDRDFAAIQREMKSDKKEIMEAGERRVIALHNRINELSETASATQEAAESCKENVRELTRVILSAPQNRVGK